MSEQCKHCLRPVVPQEIWDATEPGEGDPAYCWDTRNCHDALPPAEAYARGIREERARVVAYLREYGGHLADAIEREEHTR